MTRPAELLLERLHKVKRTGPSRWHALCPAHDDRTPSLNIREKEDGWLLLKCWCGCSAYEIVTAVGLTMSDLFPAREATACSGKSSERQRFFPRDVFDVIQKEAGVLAVIASDLAAGLTPGPDDHARLLVAEQRLNEIAEAAYAR